MPAAIVARMDREPDNPPPVGPVSGATGYDEADRPAPLLLRAEEAARLLAVSRSHFLAMHASGRLGPRPVKLGRAVRWRRLEVEAWCRAGCPSRHRWSWREGERP